MADAPWSRQDEAERTETLRRAIIEITLIFDVLDENTCECNDKNIREIRKRLEE